MEKEKRVTVREKLLKVLIENPIGVTNNQLIAVFPSFRARLSELYEDGHVIERIPLSIGTNLYRYKGFQKKELESAQTLLVKELVSNGFGEVASQLSSLLNDAGVVLHRRTLK